MSPIANMLVQIKNGQSVGKAEVMIPFSNLKFAIVSVLQKEGYVGTIEKKKKSARGGSASGGKAEIPFLQVALKPDAIRGMRFISKPSRRMYAGKDALRKVKSGYGISVISTSRGIMTGTEAHKAGIGGEVIFEIW